MKNKRGTSMGHQPSSRTWKWKMGEKRVASHEEYLKTWHITKVAHIYKTTTQNYKNATMGWKWWSNDVDRLNDMTQMW